MSCIPLRWKTLSWSQLRLVCAAIWSCLLIQNVYFQCDCHAPLPRRLVRRTKVAAARSSGRSSRIIPFLPSTVNAVPGPPSSTVNSAIRRVVHWSSAPPSTGSSKDGDHFARYDSRAQSPSSITWTLAGFGVDSRDLHLGT